MECFQNFSENYANGITALAALGALALAATTLWYLKREYSEKYRPYVFPGVDVQSIPEKRGCSVSITPKNVGSHPCKVKLINVRLNIGDETHSTPDMKEWLLLPPAGIGKFLYPSGSVSEQGVKNICEGRFHKNRIELTFEMHTISMERKYEEKIRCAYEIDVRGEHAQALLRPEWIEIA